jgi:type I restriction-modification system DNA methylase subunit
VVIGNPPYVNSKGEMFSQNFKNYSILKYKTAIYQIDTYILFIERALQLISNGGLLCFIVPNAWLSNVFLSDVRKYFLENFQIEDFALTPKMTFKDASVDTVIVTLSHCIEKKITLIKRLTEL